MKNRSITLKLILVLVVLTGGLVFIANRLNQSNLEQVTIKSSDKNLEDEVVVLSQRFAEYEQTVILRVRTASNTPLLIQAVGARNQPFINTAMQNFTLNVQLDDLALVGPGSERLYSLKSEETSPNAADEDILLRQAIAERRIVSGIIIENELAPEPAYMIAAAAPFMGADGEVKGALVIAQNLDDDLMRVLNFDRENVHLAVIYEGHLIAVHDETPEGERHTSTDFKIDQIVLDPRQIQRAEAGNVITDKKVYENDEGEYRLAYVPLAFGDSKAVGVILLNVTSDFELQSTFSRNNNIIIVISLLIGTLLLALAIQHFVITPLGQMKTVAVAVSQGNYSKQMEVRSQDEIGILAQTFNQLADAVQKREQELREVNASLEGQVQARTATLAEANQQLQTTEEQLRAQNEALVSANRDLANARRDALELVRLKSQFLATMSHELRTPLNAVIGYSEIQLAGMTGDLTQEQTDYQQRILDNAEHLLNLINDVLDLSKIEAGRVELQDDEILVKEFADSIYFQMQGLANKKNLEFILEIDSQMPATVIGDSKRMKQIIINLLSNAIKFTEKGTVRLSMGVQNGTEWQIQVSDTGAGIATHAQGYIFDEFRQVDSSSTRQHGGTGLGLAIVKKLLLLMTGKIEVVSEVGRGSTFTVTLPLRIKTPA